MKGFLLQRHYLAVVYSVSEHTSSIQARIGFISVFLAICHYTSPHTGIMKLEWWVEASLCERRFYYDLGAKSDRNEAWRPVSELVSLAVVGFQNLPRQVE